MTKVVSNKCIQGKGQGHFLIVINRNIYKKFGQVSKIKFPTFKNFIGLVIFYLKIKSSRFFLSHDIMVFYKEIQQLCRLLPTAFNQQSGILYNKIIIRLHFLALSKFDHFIHVLIYK